MQDFQNAWLSFGNLYFLKSTQQDVFICSVQYHNTMGQPHLFWEECQNRYRDL